MENKIAANAVSLFGNGSNCSQSVLTAYFKHFGLDEKLAHKLGTGLGAGVGRKQYICGAVNGGAIVLSYHFGNDDPANQEQKDKTMELVKDYLDEFENEFKSSQCLDLLGMEIQSLEGRTKANEMNLFGTTCVSCIKKVCEIVNSKIGIM